MLHNLCLHLLGPLSMVPCWHGLLTSSAGEEIHLKYNHSLPSPPRNGCFLLLDQFPKMVHWPAVQTAVPAQKRGWHGLSDDTRWALFHLLLKSVSDRAFLVCRLPVRCKPCSCSVSSLPSHFCKEQTRHQPTTKCFSTCFIMYYTKIVHDKK